MAKVVWTVEALADLGAIRTYIRQFNPDAADKLFRRLIALGDSLKEFPERGRNAGQGIREMAIGPPYIVRYAVEADRVIIMAIRHSARRPL